MDYRKIHRFETKKKIPLPVGSKAEDTLKTLRLSKDTSGQMWFSDSLSTSCAESPLDGSGSEDSVLSGPSSPSAALRSLRCRMCERLFSKMRRQEPPRKKPKKKIQDDDPASLSCDEWLLKKTWQPQRRQQSRGKLWVHLKRIRLRAAKQSDNGITNKAWSLCSRPHVFLQRNLRHCKKMFGKLSKGKAKPRRNRWRNRAKPTGPLHSGTYQRQKKRKSFEKDNTPERPSLVELTVTSEDQLPANDNTQHEDVQRLEKVPKKQSGSDVSGFMDIQRTCRVLKFDTAPSGVLAETQKPQQHLAFKSAGGNIHEGQADFTERNGDCPRRPDEVLCEDLDVFRTPPDLLSSDLKIIRKSRPARPAGARKDTFRSMLAVLGKGHNQIIKESQH